MDYAAARLNMVESQIRPNKVTDTRIVDAMLNLPREKFLPKPLRGIAYVDEDIPLGNGRYLTEPMVLARLLQAAQLRPDDVALEIGTGPGYGAAVLARIVSTVVALESAQGLAASAGRVLGELGIDNAVVVEGPLTEGYPRQAPYDVILLSGAVAKIPSAIEGQIAEGGRLVAVVAPPGEPGRAILIVRIGGVLSRRIIFDAGAPLLPGFAAEPGFVF
ncbi:MAG: protein-L-isoaspartate O-methyltransferase [Rhodospirillales bacterium]|nr:protein-L-isoaspartate O-methyltransferase [Rhodospirillales bacterium]